MRHRYRKSKNPPLCAWWAKSSHPLQSLPLPTVAASPAFATAPTTPPLWFKRAIRHGSFQGRASIGVLLAYGRLPRQLTI